jgi:hypothetical protein
MGHGSGQIFPGFGFASKSVSIRVIRVPLPLMLTLSKAKALWTRIKSDLHGSGENNYGF